MKIIILGAGQVGGTLAEHLASEANDITVVDTDGDRLRDLGDRLDIRTVQGRGSLPTVLRQAGADDADMLVAVTNSDETNMVACQVAYSLFHTPTKIARVRESAYLTREELFDNDHIPVDVLISPEQVVTNYIKRLIEHPGSLQVIDFAEGKAQLVAVKAYYGGPLVGQQLRQIRAHMPNVDTRVAAIFRRDRPITPRGDTVIEADDEVFFIAAKKDIRAVMGELRRIDETNKRVVIAGGGQIGERLAEAIESRYQVKIIEMSAARCRHLSDTLESTVVLQGSASDKDLMLEENIADADIFLALTNDDEANIMSSLLAKRLGAGKVMTIINNPAYVDLVQGGEIDIAISPQLAHHRPDVGLGGDEEHFVVSFDHGIAMRLDRPVATEDRRHPGVDVGHVCADLAQLLADQGAAIVGLDRYQLRLAFGEVDHLQRAGVLDQALDVVGHHLLGADQHVDRNVVVVEQLFAGEVGRLTHPGDLGRGMEQRIGDLAGDHVGLVAVGDRYQHVGVIGAGLAQDRWQRATALYGADIEAIAEVAQAFAIGVDHRDVVGFAGQVFRQRAAYLACAEDDDLHPLLLTFIFIRAKRQS